MFKFWGDGSQEAMDLVDGIRVRSTENFNWTFIFILAVIFYVYWSEIHKKNWKVVQAGLALYGVHWLYEICNAIIGKIFGYPLWSVSNESTTFILLIGVSWELSMMFMLAGIISYKMLPVDTNKRYFASEKFKGIDCKYIPFFLASNYVPNMKPKARNIFLIAEWSLVAILLIVLIPCGVI